MKYEEHWPYMLEKKTLCFLFVDRHMNIKNTIKLNWANNYISRGRQRSMAWDPGSLTILVL